MNIPREVPPELLANPEVKKAVNAVEESAFHRAQLLGYRKILGISSVSRKHYITALSGKEWQKELKKELKKE